MNDTCEARLSPERCRLLSAWVEYLCVALLVSELVLVTTAAAPLVLEGIGNDWPFTLLLTVWVLWAVLLFFNWQLIRCGHQAVRFTHSKRLVNRADFLVRMIFHLVINWSAIVVSLFVAAISTDPAFRLFVGRVSVIAIVVVWLAFNLLHRRMNRKRNLLMSAAVGVPLFVAAWWLMQSEFS